jgi:hypothetical protein
VINPSQSQAVVLNEIAGNAPPQCTILADVAGVRSAMQELGAQYVGRLYDLQPVAVSSGCFHPKLLILTAGEDTHLLVGSGNLTFGGWGGNLECMEHLHSSFAAEAFSDARDFFELLAEHPRVRHAAQRECAATASRLAARAGTVIGTVSAIRLLHNLRRSILDQVVEMVADLGGGAPVDCLALL